MSSSAHLILARAFFGFDGEKFGLSFDVACHAGTLIALVVYFRREIGEMIASLPYLILPGSLPAGRGVQHGDHVRLIWLLMVGTLPAVVIGLLFRNEIEARMRTPLVAGVTLALGAILLLVAERIGSKVRGEQTVTMIDATWIGCAQEAALVPGVSRSGAAITAALLLGLRRYDAARFIFLLAIPAILGAAMSEGLNVLRAGLGGTGALFVTGIVSSAIVGYVTVKYFIRYLGNHSLDGFAWYRLALAGAVAIRFWRA